MRNRWLAAWRTLKAENPEWARSVHSAILELYQHDCRCDTKEKIRYLRALVEILKEDSVRSEQLLGFPPRAGKRVYLWATTMGYLLIAEGER